MKVIVSIFLLVNIFRCTPTMVYLCNSSGGKKYHFQAKCKGLGNCQYKLIKVTLEEAKKRGKTLCKFEDRLLKSKP